MKKHIKSLFSSMISVSIGLTLYWFIKADWVDYHAYVALWAGAITGVFITYHTVVSRVES